MRRVRRKGANKEKVFGCDLMEHLTATNQEIPVVLRCCSEFVENHGIVDGIYRLSGVSSNIQKLRGEFESEGSPDLNKDLFLQDIHCVSSLCKAYFRELPNPLLTYQLYDKFAEAVAIQLEEERLVKIRDVLKELPTPHYRTLEFLMRHLVRVASFASETNMHSRNLAIVWAPNLLRSKEIEVSGFNGTAAFMEVRVQSIVVEFILTHVPQLFPEQGVSNERRKSLPSPSLLSNQDEPLFKLSPSINFGHISPGDGPLPIRPYHAIIEGTDKRKGSLKGRKWMSIFNIGGRIQETRRRHKNSTKEKDHQSLRPARSMDSLSSPSPYPNTDSRRSPRPPSTHLSPLAIPTTQPHPTPDSTTPSGALGGSSEYAVTYRRGTGIVMGSGSLLDPDGLGMSNIESRSPGLSTKTGKRQAMHITGPTTVTVPLHIASNLARVLQGEGEDKIVHCGRDKEVGDKKERKGSEVGKKKEENLEKLNKKEVLAPNDEADIGRQEQEDKKHKMKDEFGRGQCEWEVEAVSPNRLKSLSSNSGQQEEDNEKDTNEEYMDMAEVMVSHFEAETVTAAAEDIVFEAEDVLNSTEAEDLALSGYIQDNFDFLDQMDCSVMDCSVSNQAYEFSVEPPGHYEEEYETMDQSHHSPIPEYSSPLHSPTKSTPLHRHLSADAYKRHTKSLSLPHMTSPVPHPDAFSSEDEVNYEDSDDDHVYISSSEEDESMFVKSLPPDFFLSNLRNDGEIQDGDSTEQDLEVREEKLVRVESRDFKGEEEEKVLVEEKSPKEEEREKETAEEEVEEEKDLVQSTEPDNSGPIEDDVNNEETLPPSCLESPLPETEDHHISMETADNDIEVDGGPCCQYEIVESDSCHVDAPMDILETTDTDIEVEIPQNGGPTCQDEKVESESCHVDTPIDSQEMAENNIEEDSPPFKDEGAEIQSGHIGLAIEEVCQETDQKGAFDLVCEDIAINMVRNVDELLENLNDETHYVENIWDELEEVICQVIEDIETHAIPKEPAEIVDENQELLCPTGDFLDLQSVVENSTKDELDGIVELGDENFEVQSEDEAISEELANDNNANANSDANDIQNSPSPVPQNEPKLERLFDQSKETACIQGVGSKVITSKFPKVYQVKAVPVVPPKPQHCKLTALTLRQQKQQGERAKEQRFSHAKEEEEQNNVTLRAAERWREAEDGRRNSPLSMCFDEAVAIATMRRGKGKESERQKD